MKKNANQKAMKYLSCSRG